MHHLLTSPVHQFLNGVRQFIRTKFLQYSQIREVRWVSQFWTPGTSARQAGKEREACWAELGKGEAKRTAHVGIQMQAPRRALRKGHGICFTQEGLSWDIFAELES